MIKPFIKSIIPPGIPAAPMLNILQQYATSQQLPFDTTDWNNVYTIFYLYNVAAKKLN